MLSSIIWIIIAVNLIDTFNQITVWYKMENGRRRFYYSHWSIFICLSIYCSSYIRMSAIKWSHNERKFILDWHIVMQRCDSSFSTFSCYLLLKFNSFFASNYGQFTYGVHHYIFAYHPLHQFTFFEIFLDPKTQTKETTERRMLKPKRCVPENKSKQFELIFYVHCFCAETDAKVKCMYYLFSIV